MRPLALLLLLGGCVENDPLVRTGLWHPSHANAANLALAVANPRDLVRGTARPGADGQLAAAAVARLHEGKLKRLPDTGISSIALSGNGDSGGAQ